MTQGNSTPFINSYDKSDTNRYTNQPGRPVNRSNEGHVQLTNRGKVMAGIAVLSIGGALTGLAVAEILPNNAGHEIIDPSTVPAGSVLPNGGFIPAANPGNSAPMPVANPSSIVIPKH